jgi:hypothetical protein
MFVLTSVKGQYPMYEISSRAKIHVGMLVCMLVFTGIFAGKHHFTSNDFTINISYLKLWVLYERNFWINHCCYVSQNTSVYTTKLDLILKYMSEMWQPYTRKLFRVAEDGSDTFLRNAGNHVQDYAETEPRRPQFTFSPLWKPQISYNKTLWYLRRHSDTNYL